MPARLENPSRRTPLARILRHPLNHKNEDGGKRRAQRRAITRARALVAFNVRISRFPIATGPRGRLGFRRTNFSAESARISPDYRDHYGSPSGIVISPRQTSKAGGPARANESPQHDSSSILEIKRGHRTRCESNSPLPPAILVALFSLSL